ncbi:MAG: hypothetical protein UIL37_05210 [Clostridia bacterium]|nr:hypothetical protein [Clostridia bacterium]
MLGMRTGFFKGFLVGSMVGSAAYMLMDPPSAAAMRKAKRKTIRSLKNMGYIIEDMVGR